MAFQAGGKTRGCCYAHGAKLFPRHSGFSSFRCIPRSGAAKGQGCPVFVFRGASELCFLLAAPTLAAPGRLAADLPASAEPELPQRPIGGRLVPSAVSGACWPFGQLWRNVYSYSLPIFKWG